MHLNKVRSEFTEDKLDEPIIAEMMLAGTIMFYPQTADNQSNKKPDIEVSRTIRRELTKLESMSTSAKNVKVITKNGTITLKGQVKNADERSQIEDIAKKSAGQNTVVNELQIVK